MIRLRLLSCFLFICLFYDSSSFVSTFVCAFRVLEGRGMDEGPLRAIKISNWNTNRLTSEGKRKTMTRTAVMTGQGLECNDLKLFCNLP